MLIGKLLVATFAGVLCLAPALPALAEQGVYTDTTYDVEYYDWASDSSFSSTDPNTDITSVGLTHDAGEVYAGIFVREYNTLGIDFWSYEFSVDGVGEPDVRVGVLEHSGAMQVKNAAGQTLSCNEVTAVSGNERGIGLDRSCFGNPQQLYIRVAVIDVDDNDPECCQDDWTDFAPNDTARYYGPVGAPSTSTSPTPTATVSPSSSPSSSPTASPSESPTASPSASSTASPSASPSASPTASPSATSSPSSAHQVPSLTVAPFVLKFGQTANVTIYGTPGATLDLYIRKFGGSFIKIRDGLLLDSAGRITVPTRPDQNLRFQAFDRTVSQGSSIGGTDGLMTVEKYISINVQRVSAGRYTFTGSINPSHPGATVNIYRNGALWRSGITVNSSRVYSYTANLPAGTHNFQTRTSTSGYNNASTSPVRSVSVPATTTTTTSSSPPAQPADKDCSDFRTQAEAQSFFNKYYPYYGDVSGLDADGDRVACESLP